MLEPNGFWSYAKSDDEHSGGRVTLLHKKLTSELQLRVGKNHQVDIFKDTVSLPPGAEWDPAIRARLLSGNFFVAIVTPAFFQSEWCCRELMLFRKREEQLGRSDLIYPFIFLDVDHVDCTNKHQCFDPDAFALLKDRQRVDYRNHRLKPATAQAALRTIDRLSRGIYSALDIDKIDPGAVSSASALGANDRDADAKIETLLDVAEQSGAFERAGEQGISERAMREIVERLGGQGVEKDDLVKWLDDWIATAKRELGRGANEDVAFDIARGEAERRFREGLGGASAVLMDAFVREESQEKERQEERKRRRLRLLEEAIRFDELVLDADAAVAKLRVMAEVEGTTTADEIGEYLFDKAGEYYERGDQKGENAALSIAISTYREALKERTRGRVPLDWAATQNNLGNALWKLGERESRTARLKEAVAAYREALKERTRNDVPLDWAATQNNLGNALWRLGERESGTARLEEAVSAYREALQEQTRERVPLDWAKTQTNLGAVLARLGEREPGTARLEEAVAAYREALKERTQGRVPLEWATTQNNLGAALRMQGERESGTAQLEKAVAAFRNALKERTRDLVPLDWATTQTNLGNALSTLGARERRIELLHQAVEAYRLALRERTRDRVPLDWAMTQNNLGSALKTLGERESGTAHLSSAVFAFSLALEEWARDRVPLYWAMSFGSQGVTLMRIAERTGDLTMAQRAHNQIKEAFETMRDSGHAPFAAYYEKQLPEARALCERFAKKNHWPTPSP